jgi:uncharacterized protein (DUF2236 family)
MLRRVAREGVLLLGGQRALLMQIAHPAVAAGVHAHSVYRAHPLSRLLATLDALLVITFGKPAEAQAAVGRIARVHDRVKGAMSDPPAQRGQPYSAHDPGLQLWVLATLIDTSELVFQRYVRPFRDGEAEAFYRDWRRFGERFGIPERLLPPDVTAFRAYMDSMLAGGALVVTPAAATIARSLLQVPMLPGGVPLNRSITTGLLPASLREGYGLRWGAVQRLWFRAADGVVRGLRPLAAAVPVGAPEAYLTVRRVLRPE